jgi:HD-like signal output (HDOD) protein
MPGLSNRITEPWALKNVPPFRPVAVKLMRLTADKNVPLAKVLGVLRTDAAFSAEVLRLANCALVGSRLGVNSLEHAAGLLGLDRLNALSMTVGMRDFLNTPKAGSLMEACWKYNLVTAIICEWLARFLPMEPDRCYTAGLVHDIGRLSLLRAFPREYERMMSAIEDHGFDLLRCEQDLFNIDHCEAGHWLLGRWKFPNDLRQVVGLHHRQPDAGTPLLVTVVFVAWQIADMLGHSPLDLRSAATLDEVTATLPEEMRGKIFTGLDELAETVTSKLAAVQAVS